MKKPGLNWQRVCGVLESSFDVDGLDRNLKMEFPRIHREIAWGQSIGHTVFKIVETAQAHGQLPDVLTYLAADRPYRPDLQAVAFEESLRVGRDVRVHDADVRGMLEGLTTKAPPFIDTSRFAHWLIEVERQVCLVRCGGENGTGFLVAADLVLTCHHVVQEYIEKRVGAGEVQVRFDYRRPPRGGEPPSYNTGWIGIDAAWPVPHGESSAADITLAGDPDASELDFALLKLSSRIGEKTPPGEDGARRWIDLSAAPKLPAPGSPIIIVQHPLAPEEDPPQMPLQIAFSTPGFVGSNANGTRLIYRPSTRAGSSGAPVFDQSLSTPVGLHNGRGPRQSKDSELVKNNRGIPLRKIWDALSADVRALLKKPPPLA